MPIAPATLFSVTAKAFVPPLTPVVRVPTVNAALIVIVPVCAPSPSVNVPNALFPPTVPDNVAIAPLV